MKVRTTLPLALTAVVAAGALAPALAAPPKPLSESYPVTGVPVPAPVEGVPGDNSCDGTFEGLSTTTRTIKVVGAGTLDVALTGFAGDWDITITDDKGKTLAIGSGTSTADPSSVGTDLKETAVVKVKKATTLNIAVCNFLGGPTANAKYTFTYK